MDAGERCQSTSKLAMVELTWPYNAPQPVVSSQMSSRYGACNHIVVQVELTEDRACQPVIGERP